MIFLVIWGFSDKVRSSSPTVNGGFIIFFSLVFSFHFYWKDSIFFILQFSFFFFSKVGIWSPNPRHMPKITNKILLNVQTVAVCGTCQKSDPNVREVVPCLGLKDSGPFGSLPHSSLFRSKGKYLAFWPFCTSVQCRLISISLIGPDPSRSFRGPMSFPFLTPDIHTECEPMFLFLHRISYKCWFSPALIRTACTIGRGVPLKAHPTAFRASCPACL